MDDDILFADIDENETKTYFRDTLLSLIEENEISQGKLAYMVGVSQQTISKYLSGECLPSFMMIKKLSIALNCSVEDFYSYDS